MNSAGKIRAILNGIDAGEKNGTGAIFLNMIQNEFFNFDGSITVPRISVNELDYATAAGIVEQLAGYIPEFFCGHGLLESRMPPSDQHSLHFVSLLRGVLLNFIHIFKIDFLFGGDSAAVIEKGNTDYYPSYATSRIYYKSRMLPVSGVSTEGAIIETFEPVRLRDSQQVHTDHLFHAYAMFEDLNSKELSQEFCRTVGPDLFRVPLDLYQFITYDYFTACMNVPYPTPEELAAALDLFEAVFIFLYAGYKEVGGLLEQGVLIEKFGDKLSINGNKIFFIPEFIVRLKAYFNRFSLYQNDDLMLKGWRRLDIGP
jgi:hypothetical protein